MEGETDGIKREQMEEATKGRKKQGKLKHLSVIIDTQ